MALDLDPTRPLRGNRSLEALVRAVLQADEHDESQAVEWKRSLDLTTKTACFQIARTILGMSNRDVDLASTVFGGCGYIVVGAEPQDLVGVASVDPAELDDLMTQYVGSSGPGWTPSYLRIDDRIVLVVTVEPPKAGDPLWPLQKELEGSASGTVFTRRSGKTLPADAAEIEMLSRRASAEKQSPPVLSVELGGDVPLSWFDPAGYLDGFRQRVIEHREQLVQAVGMIDEQVEKDGEILQVGQNRIAIGSDLPDSVFQEESRTAEQYTLEIDEWVGRLLGVATHSWIGWYCQAGHGEVQISIRNDSDRFLTDVELKLRTSSENLDWYSVPPGAGSLLDAGTPWPYGKRRITKALRVSRASLRRNALSDPFRELLDDTFEATHPLADTVEVTGRTLICHLPKLRPQETIQLDPVWLVLHGSPSAGQLHLNWDATARDLHAVVRGAVIVEMHERPTGVLDVQQGELERIEAGARHLID